MLTALVGCQIVLKSGSPSTTEAGIPLWSSPEKISTRLKSKSLTKIFPFESTAISEASHILLALAPLQTGFIRYREVLVRV